MRDKLLMGIVLLGLAVAPALPATPAGLQQDAAAQMAAAREVPDDLTPLLAAPDSEMRMVVGWYAEDRETLSGNYANGERRGGRGGGRFGGGDEETPAPLVPLSPARIARLKSFDLAWQQAVSLIDPAGLSAAARAERDELLVTIEANLAGLEDETRRMREVMPLVPFADDIVGLVEARIRIQEIDSQAAAGTLVDIVDEIAGLTARLEAGVEGDTGDDALRVDPELAGVGADAADQLGEMTQEWFEFYFGYDPVFTWWVEMPYRKVDEAVDAYATFLRDDVAAAGMTSNLPPVDATPIPPAEAPVIRQVPDLEQIMALPQDEMRGVVDRFNEGTGLGRRGRGRGGDAPEPAGPEYYRAWLESLQTLDFDALSRNAQVDYLYLKHTSEMRIERAGITLPENPPRKTDDSGIEGPARGRQGLLLDLSEEMIPYTPEQLFVIAEEEFAWCEEEMLKASRELGFGDDWKAALEYVKETYVPPGDQPVMIRDLVHEAVDYLRLNDLVTVPQVASESLHMEMMSPERQLTAPFFLGGSRILVSYPTNTMDHEARLQSMRGNNPGFSHATAHHELIPGHNLTGFMGSRYDGYRAELQAGTPFFSEGWALYWELILYDMGFNTTPEQRIGALFWRMHRCARILFSLRFHMGLWSPQESIDFLVDRVGHERDNATAEVRRSFEGNYGPLYQAAYLLGGMQLRGLRREIVDTGLMTNIEFHDEILRQGSMPVALIRLALTPEELTREMPIEWEFAGPIEVQ